MVTRSISHRGLLDSLRSEGCGRLQREVVRRVALAGLVAVSLSLGIAH